MKPRQRQRLEKVKNKLVEQDKHEDRVPDDPITFCREWLRDKPNILYNYCIVNNVVKKILLLMNPDEHINIHIDRSLSRTNREDFNLYVRDKVSWVWEIELEKQPSLKPNQIQVAHENSHSDPCIQLVDYIAGATFQKYERNRPKYYALIESRVESFTYLW